MEKELLGGSVRPFTFGDVMSAWQLFADGEIPFFTTPEFFAAHPWIEPVHQVGHAQRMLMTSTAITDLAATGVIGNMVDLGCGDGSLMELIISALGTDIPVYGYDGCLASIDKAHEKGLEVNFADIRKLAPLLTEVDLIVASEVVEHLVDPHGFIASIKSPYLILTSPSAEDADWHYEHHAWAWDTTGYANMVESCGWEVISHVSCDAPSVDHGTGLRAQQFQCITATRINDGL